MSDPTRGFGRLVGGLYLVGILCVLFPPADLLTNVWPLRPGDVQWRYGAVGIGSGFLLTPLLGLSLIALLAAVRGQVGVLRTTGIVALFAGVVLLVVTGVFVLDALQVRVGVAPAERGIFHAAAFRALAKNLFCVGAFLWLGIGALAAIKSASQRGRGGGRSDRRGGDGVLLG